MEVDMKGCRRHAVQIEYPKAENADHNNSE